MKTYFYDNVWYFLKQRKQTMAWLENTIDVSPGYISRFKNGKKTLSARILYETARIFEVTMEDMLWKDFSTENQEEDLVAEIEFKKKLLEELRANKAK